MASEGKFQFPFQTGGVACKTVRPGRESGSKCCAYCAFNEGKVNCPQTTTQRHRGRHYCRYHQACYRAVAAYEPVKKRLEDNRLFNGKISPYDRHEIHKYAWRSKSERQTRGPPPFVLQLLKEAGWDKSWEEPNEKPWEENAKSSWEVRWLNFEWPQIKVLLDGLEADIKTSIDLRSQARECFNTEAGCGEEVKGHDHFIYRLKKWLTYIQSLLDEHRMKKVVWQKKTAAVAQTSSAEQKEGGAEDEEERDRRDHLETCKQCLLDRAFYDSDRYCQKCGGAISFWKTLELKERLKGGWSRDDDTQGEKQKYVGEAVDGNPVVLTVRPDGHWIKESDGGWTETDIDGRETTGDGEYMTEEELYQSIFEDQGTGTETESESESETES